MRENIRKEKLTNRVVEYIIKGKPLDFADLNVNEIARRFKVSVPHLSRSFKLEQGICLKEFLLKEKITRSRFLLTQNRRMTIKELASALDFCSCDYFIRVFKKYVRMTPGRYRKIKGDFYGLQDRRTGPIDRRSGIKNRRNNNNYNQLNLILTTKSGDDYPIHKDRRSGPADRRKGSRDRRRPINSPLKPNE
jgi:AraC-like DNA-binding protein